MASEGVSGRTRLRLVGPGAESADLGARPRGRIFLVFCSPSFRRVAFSRDFLTALPNLSSWPLDLVPRRTGAVEREVDFGPRECVPGRRLIFNRAVGRVGTRGFEPDGEPSLLKRSLRRCSILLSHIG